MFSSKNIEARRNRIEAQRDVMDMLFDLLAECTDDEGFRAMAVLPKKVITLTRTAQKLLDDVTNRSEEDDRHKYARAACEAVDKALEVLVNFRQEHDVK